VLGRGFERFAPLRLFFFSSRPRARNGLNFSSWTLDSLFFAPNILPLGHANTDAASIEGAAPLPPLAGRDRRFVPRLQRATLP